MPANSERSKKTNNTQGIKKGVIKTLNKDTIAEKKLCDQTGHAIFFCYIMGKKKSGKIIYIPGRYS